MSGHSKWSKIKRDKGVKDKQKSGIFSKLARIITLAVLEGGGITDPENNIKLRLAIEKAKSLNFPKENILRAIEKAAGPNSQNLKEVIYEGFGPGGVLLVIQATTDNQNRTLTEVRNTLDMNNGKLGIQGSVMYLFKKCGLAVFSTGGVNEQEILAFVERIGAFDFDKDDEHYYVYFPYQSLSNIKNLLGEIKTENIEIDYKPTTEIELEDENVVKSILDLKAALEDLDDVHKVYINAKI